MDAIVWTVLGFSSLAGVIWISDWVKAHRVVLIDRPASRPAPSVRPWALEELMFLQAAERLTQVDAGGLGTSSMLGDRSAVAA